MKITSAESMADPDWTMPPPAIEDAESFQDSPESDYLDGYTASSQINGFTTSPFIDQQDYWETDMPFGKLKTSPPEAPFEYLLTPSLTTSLAPSETSSACYSLGGDRRMTPPDIQIPSNLRGISTNMSTKFPSSVWRDSAISTFTNMPTFMQLLRKCSELEQDIESMRKLSCLPSGSGTSSSSHELTGVQDSVDSAGLLVQRVAGMTQYRPKSFSSFSSDEDSNSGMYDGPVQNISPSALMRDASSSCAHHNHHNQEEELQPALLCLALTLVLKIIEVCDLLTRVRLTDTSSHNHMLFLKRLESSISHVQGSIGMVQSHKEATRGGPAHDAMHRAVMVQQRIYHSMKNNFTFNHF